jgi:predicted RNA methylase
LHIWLKVFKYGEYLTSISEHLLKSPIDGPIKGSKNMPTSRSSQFTEAILKALQLIRSGRSDLLMAIPLYRLWWRLRGLDFGYVSLQELGLDAERANYHKDGGGPLLCDLLKQLEISESDAALDLGSGKGGAMATLARFPFRQVDGVEISPKLVAAANKNLAKLKIRKCSVYLADASTFTELDDYTHIFMYNPFPAVVVTQVLANLEASLRRKSRSVRLLYSNPLHEQVILVTCVFMKAFVYEPYPDYRISVYENRAPSLREREQRAARSGRPTTLDSSPRSE